MPNDRNYSAYLEDGFGATPVDPEHDRVIPDYIVAEAAREGESWEEEFKSRLAVESAAREFRNKFLEDFKIENHQQVRQWRPEAAAEWLTKFVKLPDDKIDIAKAVSIMEEAGAVDELRTDVLSHMGNEGNAAKPEKESPADALERAEVPERLADLEVEKAEEAHRAKKTVGAYTLLLKDDSLSLYKKANLLASIASEDCGGVDVLADEMGAITTEADVESLFGLEKSAAQLIPITLSKGVGGETFFDGKRCYYDPEKDVLLVGDQEIPAVELPGEVIHEMESQITPHDSPARKASVDSSWLKVATPVVSNPDLEYNDTDQVMNDGEFQKDHVVNMPGKQVEVDPGPASLTPGADAPVVTRIPDNEGFE